MNARFQKNAVDGMTSVLRTVACAAALILSASCAPISEFIQQSAPPDPRSVNLKIAANDLLTMRDPSHCSYVSLYNYNSPPPTSYNALVYYPGTHLNFGAGIFPVPPGSYQRHWKITEVQLDEAFAMCAVDSLDSLYIVITSARSPWEFARPASGCDVLYPPLFMKDPNNFLDCLNDWGEITETGAPLFVLPPAE